MLGGPDGRRQGASDRECRGGRHDPPGRLLTHLHRIYMPVSGGFCVSSYPLKPLAERNIWSQACAALPPPPAGRTRWAPGTRLALCFAIFNFRSLLTSRCAGHRWPRQPPAPTRRSRGRSPTRGIRPAGRRLRPWRRPCPRSCMTSAPLSAPFPGRSSRPRALHSKSSLCRFCTALGRSTALFGGSRPGQTPGYASRQLKQMQRNRARELRRRSAPARPRRTPRSRGVPRVRAQRPHSTLATCRTALAC
jgi:hypothetical protein